MRPWVSSSTSCGKPRHKGGEETRVLEEIFLGLCHLGRQGMYFVKKADERSARTGRVPLDSSFDFLFIPFAGRKTRQIAAIRQRFGSIFSVSPDERSILYTQGYQSQPTWCS